MRKPYIHIIIGMVMLLLASCGQQHDAEQLVTEFMKENMRDMSQISSVYFDKIDSTKVITDSTIADIRVRAKESDRYKADVKYSGRDDVKMLLILRVRYRMNEDDWCDTFYLNPDLTGVVAFKTY